MKFMPYLLAIFFCLISTSASSEEVAYKKIIEGLKNLGSDLVADDISPSPIPGLYQVLIGAEILYVSENGRYVMNGDIFDVENKENISEAEKSIVRADALHKVPESELIEFSPENPEHTLYVFTDITCGYCRKLHKDVPELNKNGIAIKYLAYPRAGVNSTSAYELSAVWCAENRNKALTDAKTGVQISSQECDDPVERHYALGQAIGVQGTPAIFLENGKAVPGYFPPDELIRIVNK